jgi:hypothetical protein
MQLTELFHGLTYSMETVQSITISSEPVPFPEIKSITCSDELTECLALANHNRVCALVSSYCQLQGMGFGFRTETNDIPAAARPHPKQSDGMATTAGMFPGNSR